MIIQAYYDESYYSLTHHHIILNLIINEENLLLANYFQKNEEKFESEALGVATQKPTL